VHDLTEHEKHPPAVEVTDGIAQESIRGSSVDYDSHYHYQPREPIQSAYERMPQGRMRLLTPANPRRERREEHDAGRTDEMVQDEKGTPDEQRKGNLLAYYQRMKPRKDTPLHICKA
jgi:hypothetical protein